MKPSDFRFHHPLRVRWGEVDVQQIVFNPHYLMYFDVAVGDYWRALAMPYAAAYAAAGRRHLPAQDHGGIQRLGADGRPA